MTDNQEKVVEPSNVVELPDNIKPEDFPDLLEKTLITFNNGDVIEGLLFGLIVMKSWLTLVTNQKELYLLENFL